MQWHDRERIYQKLWERCDRLGMLRPTQQELATELDIPYQRLSVIMKEFQDVGYVKKFRWKFQLKNPEGLDWSMFKDQRTS